ncbi:MAG: hypothetical protein PHG89_10800 [Gallionella sp.]|nr:hypothetical protein [Gallionella sp.]
MSNPTGINQYTKGGGKGASSKNIPAAFVRNMLKTKSYKTKALVTSDTRIKRGPNKGKMSNIVSVVNRKK